MKIKSKIFYCYVALVATYIAVMLLPAPDPATLTRYHLSILSLRLLDFTIIIPMAAIWYAAFYGYTKLHAYGQLIKDNKDGKQVARLARGLLTLAIGLPLSSILSNALHVIARDHPSFTGGATIIGNYGAVLYPLIAFLFISMGARGLSELAKSRPTYLTLNVVALTVIVLGVVFCDLIARSHHNIVTSYHLTYSLVMLTLAIPYMYVWFLGLFATVEIYVYSRKVAGIVYRKGWNKLALGFGAIILFSIVLQYLTTLSSWLTGLSLSGILLLLYVLLLLLASAYIVVALGTKELMKIEEA